MNWVRNRKTTNVFIAFWCVVLFNMSFLTLEVSILKTWDANTAENVSKIISFIPFEEETDHSQHSEAKEILNEIDLAANNLNHGAHDNVSAAVKLKTIHHECETRTGHTETYSPPPDLS